MNDDDLSLHYVNYSPVTWNDEKKNFEHSKAPSKRNRRGAINVPSSSLLKLDAHGVLTISDGPADEKPHRRRLRRSVPRTEEEMERIYIQSTDLVSSLQSPSAEDRHQHNANTNGTAQAANGDYEDNQIRAANRTNDDNDGAVGGRPVGQFNLLQNASAPQQEQQQPGAKEQQSASANSDTGNGLRRVKRKSGKTTGALSRPKSDSGSSSSKSTSRKTQCKLQIQTRMSLLFPLPLLCSVSVPVHSKR